MKGRFPVCCWSAALGVVACGPEPASPQVPSPRPNPTASAASPDATAERPHFGPPLARREPVEFQVAGQRVSDPYRWLENWEDEETQRWTRSYDRFTRDYLAKLPGREALSRRLTQLLYLEWVGVPQRRGQRYFFSHRKQQDEKASYFVRQGKTGEARLLLDPTTLSADGSVAVHLWSPSWDGKKVAYKLSENNRDDSTLYVMDVASGKNLSERIPGARYARTVWEPDSGGFYYVRLPADASIPVPELPGHAAVYHHRLGSDPAADPLIFEASGDPRVFSAVDLSRDGRWLLTYRFHGWTRSDAYLRDLKKPGSKLEPLIVGDEHKYSFFVWQGWAYVHTNWQAPRWRLLRFRPEKPERESWQEIVPQREDAVLDSFEIVGGHLGLSYLKDAATELVVARLDGSGARKLELPAIGTASGLAGLPEDDTAYYGFTSFTYPTTTFELSVSRGVSKQYFELDAPVDPEPFAVEQVFYSSKDGTRVPMFVVQKKGAKRNGSEPFYLTGYGGFDVNRTPYFSAEIFAWLEAGGGFALANLRGGGEYGEDWHKAGMREKKQNVFDDFIAAAEYLVRHGYTRPERLAIAGGSNGGLLVGAALTQRPELFGAVVCYVPLLDMLRYHLFGAGKTWISEYGSADDADVAPALVAYSPYHQLKPGTAYPPLLMMSADSDDRVDPLHARKFVAHLQFASSDPDAPVLLRVESNAGHGGGDLRKKEVEEATDVYSFLFHVLGMKPPGE